MKGGDIIEKSVSPNGALIVQIKSQRALNTIKVVARKKWGENGKPKKTVQCNM